MDYTVYYMKPDHFRTFIFGDVRPTIDTLKDTHVLLRVVKAESLEEVFWRMQGEIWSPNGEARELIQSKGLSHTSMSVGDVVCDEDENYHVVANVGFKQL